MAGTKKKKPASNPARGFATVSIASKPRPEVVAAEDSKSLSSHNKSCNSPLSTNKNAPPSTTSTKLAHDTHMTKDVPLSAEEFEQQLEESELQLLVEKYSQKVKRDAQRQRSRLETDRRVLRGQAESLNSQKWLSQELMDHILDLIKAESRFSASNISSENNATGKIPSEEDTVTRLWTLQQTLAAIAFPQTRIQAALNHVLEIASSISYTPRDIIWGLDEALDWLARECISSELPQYENKAKAISRDTPSDSPTPSRSNTPHPGDFNNSRKKRGEDSTSRTRKAKVTLACDSDIEPDDLVPEYIAVKSRLLELSRDSVLKNTKTRVEGSSVETAENHYELAKLEAKLIKIEGDILFDQSIAEEQWKFKRIVLEKKLAASKKETKARSGESPQSKDAKVGHEDIDDVNAEAEHVAAQLLAKNQGDDETIVGLFESLPQNEVDSVTGEIQTVIHSPGGEKLVVRDFGKWTGVNPRRILEEACRSRDTSVRISYNVVSETAFANRHSLEIGWTKPQEIPQFTPRPDLKIGVGPTHFTFTMAGIATPDAKQSEAFAATVSLFYIFSGNAREEKVGLRLPPVWRDLWLEMADAKKSHADFQDREVIRNLRGLVRKKQDQELEDGVILQGAFKGRGGIKSSSDRPDAGLQDRPRQSTANGDNWKRLWESKCSSHKFQAMLQYRTQLPMWTFRPQVLEAVDKNQVVIICGETGCGKSTQVPAFLLEHELRKGNSCKIYCTEPRRISAISLARRVSEELGESRSDLGTSKSLVGYSIRLESNTCKETRLIYATTGIVMRMLEGSSDLQEVTHLILDEVHERSIDSDFLLVVVKRLLAQRRDLKVVLMSATVDAERFSAYLAGAPVLNVPGRTFPVEVRYLEDAVELTGYTPNTSQPDKMVDLDDLIDGEGDVPRSDTSTNLAGYSPRTRAIVSQIDEYHIEFDLIVQLMTRIATDESLRPYSSALLVFLPGIAEIRTLNDLLLGDPHFSKDWLIYPLHSSIATEDQEAAFRVPPLGMRKVVLATNIAETGITIPDVTCVIDAGKHREMRFDEKKQLSRLIDTFISRANAKQRRGRAGRVQNGICYHMFTKHRHDNLMSDQQTPEMLRLSLQDLAIRVKICKIGGIEEILSDALDPPSAKNIRRAIDALVDVRALTAAEELTPLGHQLARLPLDVFLGKLILFGTVFKCLDMAITVAAILSSKSPFSAPFGQRTQADNARMAFRRSDSDLLTVYNAYLAWKRVCQSNSGVGKEFQFCRKNFMSQQTLANIEDLKGQLLVSLADSGFLSLTDEERRTLSRLRFAPNHRGRRLQHFFEVPQRVDTNSDNDIISASVISWSFYPKLLVRDTPGTKGVRNIGNNQTISLHPTSVNRGILDLKWLSYYNIMQTKTVYRAHETTAAEPFSIALLCGDVRCDMYAGVIVLDGNRARFAVSDWKTMLVIKVLRTRLRELLTRSFKQPGKLLTAQQVKWFDIWQRIFSQDFSQDKIVVTVKIAT